VIPPDFRLSSYDYPLPPELVAQEPLAERDASRLLVLERATGAVAHRVFRDLPELLRSGDLLITNRSRVFPARLVGRRPKGGRAEVLLVRQRPDGLWDAMLRPGRRLRDGMLVEIAQGFQVQVAGMDRPEGASQGPAEPGDTVVSAPGAPEPREPPEPPPPGGAANVLRQVRLVLRGMTEAEALERHGHAPLPPYIRREDRTDDRARYQTVYAREPGSVAAPTAGLHFTPELLARLAARGVERAELVLHVGPGTFRPVEVDDVRHHRVDAERYSIPEETAAAFARAREEGRRIVAVGTTATRALEAALAPDGKLRAGPGETSLVIVPGRPFRAVDGLVTNFHLPQSSLLLLACAFAGRERLLAAYREAVERRYRFYSYGDAMLIA
jgi:S-adenosylmethionine:tRNA ribosyltransferase-isomerase